MKRLAFLLCAVFMLSGVAYAETPLPVDPTSIEVVAPVDPPPVDDGAEAPTDLPPVDDSAEAPTDLPPVDDGAEAPTDLPPVDDGITLVEASPYSDPEIVTLLSEILNRIDFVLFVCVPFIVSIALVCLGCFWFFKMFIQ